MIATAVYERLNHTSITSLVSGIYNTTAPQKETYPYIVFRESSEPEHFKTGSDIRVHRVQIAIICNKGKFGRSAIEESDAIASAVEARLNRFTGISGGKMIQGAYLEDTDVYYDQVSHDSVVELTYSIRENYTEALADPANYPITYVINVNGVQDSTGTINGYENNTFNITAS